MTRKLAAFLTALAVALCFSRAAAWAALARGGDAHACCRHEAPAKPPVLSECCAPAAAVGAVMFVRAVGPALSSALPVLAAPPAVDVVVPDASAPPGVFADRAAVPARAPPLA